MYNPRTQEKESGPSIHPIWRGIGCILFIIVPFISLALADLIIESNISQIQIPAAMQGTLDIGIMEPIRFFYAKAFFAIIISVAAFAILAFIYALVYRLTGGGARGPMDAPPIRHKVKKRDL
ncbi:MAG: hypothetical protein OEV06_11920 [Anaerolineae bacterium]|nr:hypothetical protein [Anaerolineae bacterium]